MNIKLIRVESTNLLELFSITSGSPFNPLPLLHHEQEFYKVFFRQFESEASCQMTGLHKCPSKTNNNIADIDLKIIKHLP